MRFAARSRTCRPEDYRAAMKTAREEFVEAFMRDESLGPYTIKLQKLLKIYPRVDGRRRK